MQRIHNETLRIITSSHKMSRIDHIHNETMILLVEDHLNLLSVQYLVHCLDTENVCHHISTMDHPPREIKGTLFTRHNQNVLPLLANTKKESLQAIHPSFVNTPIDNMMDNTRKRILRDDNGPLLSQLRSGHCKLLNSYKKRLK